MKQVTFNDGKNKIYKIITWKFAYNSARKKYWEFFAIDRIHFQRRIIETQEVINPILDRNHRHKIFTERFCKQL